MLDMTRRAVRTIARDLVALEVASRSATVRERRDAEVARNASQDVLRTLGLLDLASMMMAEAKNAEHVTEARRLLTQAWAQLENGTPDDREQHRQAVENAVRNLARAEARPYEAGPGGSASGEGRSVTRAAGHGTVSVVAGGMSVVFVSSSGFAEVGQNIEAWVPWDGINENLYQVGDRVTHNGQVWVSTTPNNHWEPGTPGTESLWAPE